MALRVRWAKRRGMEAVRWLLLKSRLLPKEGQLLAKIDESKFSMQSRALIWCIQKLAGSEHGSFERIFLRISRLQRTYPDTRLVFVTGDQKKDAALARTAFELQGLERPLEVAEKELTRCQRQLGLVQSQRKKSREAIAHWKKEAMAKRQELALLEDRAISLQRQIRESLLQGKKD